MYEVIPSPGTDNHDWPALEAKIELLKAFSKTIHIDIVDGKFAPNTTFLDPAPFTKYRDLFLELHMMVDNPIQYLKPFANAGFKRFFGHIEKMPDQAEFVAQAQLLGKVGLAIDGPTSLESIKVPYSDLDSILIMTIKAKESGQTFIAEYLEKVRKIRQQNEFLPIEVDGGINDQTIVKAKNAGATRFASTTFIFGNNNPQGQFNLLTKCLE